ncbi:endothelin-converting enzyme 2-like isoform X2 [Pomacea canaliculata]|uniref:endothelin-converting enzyme 2-like isoform X2 n=1 Tax=Pomacea canaliculata TaxID=400727 RepID=UPI000D739F02|nr:endothelin-converting enzyme 2-like isoform X2 [Pomacea canaliculata]
MSKALQGVCQTLDCVLSAEYITKNIDDRRDPCKDFYQFTCGGWIEQNPIFLPSDNYDKFVSAHITVRDIIRGLLDVDDSTAPEAVQQARAYFRSCMDVDTLSNRGIEPLVDFLDRDTIHPTLQPLWTDTGMTFTDIVEYFANLGGIGFGILVNFVVGPDELQSDKNIIVFLQTSLALGNRNNYFGKRTSMSLKNLEAIYELTHTMLGADPITAAQDAEDVVDFEIKLAEATVPPEEQKDRFKVYKKMTVANLTDRFPQFDWLRFLRNQFSKTGEDYNITMDEVVAIDSLQYYENLFNLVDETPTRTLLNYGMWRVVQMLFRLLDPALKELLYGPMDVENQCVQQTTAFFSFAVDRMYVNKMSSPHEKLKVENITESLLKTFKKMLKNSWLSQATKTAALKKLNSIVRKIGYPEFVLDDKALNAKSDMYSVDKDDFFGTNLDIALKRKLLMMNKLRKQVDRTEWLMTTATVNAYYNPKVNEMVVPAGILLLPFYSKRFSDALLYGAIGTVIAHEITHVIQGAGANRDENGSLRKWWRQKDQKILQNRTQCLVDQYNNFVDKVVNLHVDGLLTLDENVADISGLKVAFKAYRSVIKERGREEDKYPTLPYTPDQLFFIGATQVMCSNYGPAVRLQRLRDNHSPNYFRVMGSIQNNEDFGRVFNCPVGKPMNPKHKCQFL